MYVCRLLGYCNQTAMAFKKKKGDVKISSAVGPPECGDPVALKCTPILYDIIRHKSTLHLKDRSMTGKPRKQDWRESEWNGRCCDGVENLFQSFRHSHRNGKNLKQYGFSRSCHRKRTNIVWSGQRAWYSWSSYSGSITASHEVSAVSYSRLGEF